MFQISDGCYMNVNDYIRTTRVETEEPDGLLRRLQYNKGSQSHSVILPRKLLTKIGFVKGDYLRLKQFNEDSIIIKKVKFAGEKE